MRVRRSGITALAFLIITGLGSGPSAAAAAGVVGGHRKLPGPQPRDLSRPERRWTHGARTSGPLSPRSVGRYVVALDRPAPGRVQGASSLRCHGA